MKRRPSPPRPPIVEVRRRPAAAPAAPALRRATPARGIRSWRADDRVRDEQEAFERKPTLEQEAEAESWFLARFKCANDPDIERQIARQGVGRDFAEAAMSHMQIIEDPRDPRAVLRPLKGRWVLLKRGLGMQYGSSKLVVTDPKAPGKFSLFDYIRKLRNQTDE